MTLGTLSMVGPFPPLRGGIAQFNQRASEALGARDLGIEKVPFRRLYPDLLFPGESQFEPGMGAPERGIDPMKPWTWRAGEKGDATILAYWSPVHAIPLRIVGAQSSRPVIGLIHNALPHERLPASRLLARLFLSGCDAVLTLSESVAADVKELGYSRPIVTTPHPAYDQYGEAPDRLVARKQLGLGDDDQVLLFFGLVRRYKGLDVLLEAFPELLRHNPRIVLVVAGEFYDDAVQYREMADRLGIAASVRFEDRFIPENDVAAYFGAADVVVQPYRTATQSGVLNVAAHFGKPVVVSGVGGLAEAVDAFGAGRVVGPEDPDALAGAIRDVLEPQALAAYGEGALRLGNARGWPVFCETLEALIRNTR